MFNLTQKKTAIAVAIAMTGSLLAFQNCSEVSFQTVPGGSNKPFTGPFDRDYTVSGTDSRKADILFLVDTSGSMSYEQTQIANRFSGFINTLTGMDWRVAISTMLMKDMLQKDARGQNTNENVTGANGKLIPFAPGLLFLTNTTANANSLFAYHITHPQTCGFGVDDCDDHERGIYNANLLIDNKDIHGFFRADANLNMVFVSDENERSDGDNLETYDLPETLKINVEQKLNPRSFTAHSIIFKPTDDKANCTEGSRHGTVYNDLSVATDGIVGSVCEADYTSQLKVIADNIVQTSNSLKLPCSNPTIVQIDFTPALDPTITYEVKKSLLVFSAPLPDGQKIHVVGDCPKPL